MEPIPRRNVTTGAKWEEVVGYSRLVQAGPHVFVTGTTAWLPSGGYAGAGDAGAQARQAIKNIERALAEVGAGLKDVVRTRLFLVDIRRDWEAVGRAHAEAFGDVRPATTMVEVSRLIEEWMLVEIEADVVIGARG